ncbi:MAG: hypothetical protein R3B68_05920 [Phycisphaerales bacterium]
MRFGGVIEGRTDPLQESGHLHPPSSPGGAWSRAGGTLEFAPDESGCAGSAPAWDRPEQHDRVA